MADIQEFSTDIAFVSKLPDSPDLPYQELQAVFDQSGLTIQQWLNEVLIPAVNAIKAITGETDKTMTRDGAPADAKQVGVLLGQQNTTINGINRRVTNMEAPGGISGEQVADGAIAPEKLSKPYFASLEAIVLTPGVHYDDTLPSPGTPGRLFFKKA